MRGLENFCIKNLPSNFKILKVESPRTLIFEGIPGENLWDYRILGLVTEGMLVALLLSLQYNTAITRAQSDTKL